MEHERSRFSDEQLFQFHDQFLAHVEQAEKREERDEKRFAAMMDAQERNIQAITLLTEETRVVVQLSKDVQAAARIGGGIQRFGLWILKWPLIGAGMYTAFNWIVDHLPK